MIIQLLLVQGSFLPNFQSIVVFDTPASLPCRTKLAAFALHRVQLDAACKNCVASHMWLVSSVMGCT